jgi:hypothetical protein
MPLPPPRYQRCLITGASSGLGRDFALQLAPVAERLILVARRGDRLEQLSKEILEAHGTSCRVEPADLSRPGAGTDLLARLEQAGEGAIDLLVNNAGFGRVGALADFPPEDFESMVAVNVAALTELTVRSWPVLTAEPGRGVIHVASCAGFQPIPYFTVYAATKAYVRALSNGLAVEGRSHGTRVLSLCPGPVATEFGDVAGAGFSAALKGSGTSPHVVRHGLRAYARGRMESIPGWRNKLLAYATRLIPVALTARLAGSVLALMADRGTPGRRSADR